MQGYKSWQTRRLPTLSLVVAGAAGLLTVGACDDERIIGDGDGSCPCDETGSSASGKLELDGLLRATESLRENVSTSMASFEASLGRLEYAFGVPSRGDLKARVDTLIAAIRVDVQDHAEGGLSVQLGRAMCSANLTVLAEAQAQCEAQNDCDVELDPGNIDVACDGTCVGACSGSCAANTVAYCREEAPGTPCSGSCDGVCETAGATACQGTCWGTCTGECTLYDAQGRCRGACDGNCSGICEIEGDASCNGSCTGSCTTESIDGECGANAELRCDGTCEGTCSGSCEGRATLPGASADCDASSNCQMQATAQADADVQCTPPTVNIAYRFAGDATAEATFSAKLAVLRAEAPAMFVAFTRMKALIDGEVHGEVVFDPAPIGSISAALESVIDAGIDGDLFADVPVGRVPCVIPALTSSVTLLADTTNEASASLAAQEAFVSALAAGFTT